MSEPSDALALTVALRELWRLLSVAFTDPFAGERIGCLGQDEFRRTMAEAYTIARASLSEVEPGPGEEAPSSISPDLLFEAYDAEGGKLEGAYRELFGLTSVALACPPCGVEYESNRDISYRAQRLADIAGFYRAFGLERSGRASERLDHISIEAEFLFWLRAKEAAAMERGLEEPIEICRDARRKFFAEHVGWWLPTFSRLLKKTAPSPFYRSLACLSGALSALERTTLGLSPFPRLAGPRPLEEKLGEGCAGCVA